MKTAMSWIHFICCVVFLIWTLYALLEYGLRDSEGIIVILYALLTSVTGIYLFVIEQKQDHKQLKKIRTDNKIIQAKLERLKLQQELSSKQRETNEKSN
ncbi:hypothetical protein [Sedimentisphaera salicampi]|nr:hypothetical protein [Sedimentisphaera salicampi]